MSDAAGDVWAIDGRAALGGASAVAVAAMVLVICRAETSVSPCPKATVTMEGSRSMYIVAVSTSDPRRLRWGFNAKPIN